MYNPKAFPSKDHEAEPVNHIGYMRAVKSKSGEISGYMLTTYLDQSGFNLKSGDSSKFDKIDTDPHTTPRHRGADGKMVDGIFINTSQAESIMEKGNVIPTAANPDNYLVSFSAPMTYIARKDGYGRNEAMPNLSEISGKGYFRTGAVKSETIMLERFAASQDNARLAREAKRVKDTSGEKLDETVEQVAEAPVAEAAAPEAPVAAKEAEPVAAPAAADGPSELADMLTGDEEIAF